MDAEEGGGTFGKVADKSAAVLGWVLAHLTHFNMETKLFTGTCFNTVFSLTLRIFLN